MLEKPVDVKLGDGRIVTATKIGRINTSFQIYNRDCQVTLYNVFYVKEMKRNLISYAKVTVKNKIISYGNTSKIYNQNNELIAIARKENDMYHMTSFVTDTIQNKEVNINQVTSNNKMTLKEKWHRKLGHVNFNYLNILCKNELLQEMPKELESEHMKCKICIQSKMHNLPFKNNRKQAKEILEIIHTDLNGPHSTVGNNGEKYFLSFVDEYSKLAKVYCIKSKSEIYDCFVQYINLVENLTDKRVKTIRCDNGKEYLNSNIYKFVKDKGIYISPCPPYVHELNGVAERYNRSIMDTARCLLAEAKVNKMYWPEIVKAAAYLKNRTLANTIERKTPYEIFFKSKPNAKYLRLYGSRVFVRTPEQLRKSKWDNKAQLGVLLGYTEVGYRILLNNKIIDARHVDIVENDVRCIGFNAEDVSNNENADEDVEIKDQSESDDEEITTKIDTNPEEINYKRSLRERKPNTKYDKDFVTYCVYVNYCNANVPDTFKEALESNESKEWKRAMTKEIKSLEKNRTWKLVKRPKDKKVIDVKWVFRKKANDIYKAQISR